MPLPAVNDLTAGADGGGPAQAGRRRPGAGLRRSAGEGDPREDRGAPRSGRSRCRRPVANRGPARCSSFGQKVLYGGVFDVKVTGKSFVPQNRNFLVIANHASHLDMGLVKHAARASRASSWSRWPRGTTSSTRRSSAPTSRTSPTSSRWTATARCASRCGWRARRSSRATTCSSSPRARAPPTGELLEFKPTLGYLALTYEVDVLPLYLEGTYEALPKGPCSPRRRSWRSTSARR